jgi:hypothetical protein
VTFCACGKPATLFQASPYWSEGRWVCKRCQVTTWSPTWDKILGLSPSLETPAGGTAACVTSPESRLDIERGAV